MSRRTYAVTCLARHGIGPEVMAVASRALAATSRLHGFEVDDRHVPFGADAVMRFGRPFPPSSRLVILAADAVLVGCRSDAVLEALEAELDLRTFVGRVRYEGRSELSVVAPIGDDAWEWTLERAFSLARWSHGRVALVGVDGRWERHARMAERRRDALDVERVDARAAMRALVFTPDRFDVLVCPPELAATASELAASFAEARTAAWGRLSPTAPSIFGADHGVARDVAGQDAADPSSMLLATALMLGEGLGERGAASTLAGAIALAGAHARGNGAHGSSTRERADLVLAQLPSAVENAEFYREAVCG